MELSFEFDSLKITIVEAKKILDEKIAVISNLNNFGRVEYDHIENKKVLIYIFDRLEVINDDLDYEVAIDNVFNLIDFIEILKSFSSNRLYLQKTYSYKTFQAKIVQKDEILLEIAFSNNVTMYFDKIQCSSIAAKISKILQKCEVVYGNIEYTA